MKRALILSFCLSFLALTGWSQSVFESFDTVADWTVFGNDLTKAPPTGTATATQETTVKTEGTGSVKLVYNYSGNQWYEAGIKKTLTTPVDLSEAVGLSFDMYGQDGTGADLIWYIVFNTDTGKSFRYVDWSGVPGTGWNTYTLSFRTDMQANPWQNHRDNPMLNKVTEIQIIFQQVSGIAAGGTFTTYLDNMQLQTTGSDTQMFTIDDFNSYADTAALGAVWSAPATTAGTQTMSLDTTDPFEGSGCLQMDYSVAKSQLSFFASMTPEVALNLGIIDYFKIRIKGDSNNAPAGRNPVLHLYLQDPSNNAVRAWITKGVISPDWNTYLLYADNGGEGACDASPASTFEQEVWDAGGTAGVNFLTKFSLRLLDTVVADPSPAYPVILKIDKIEYARLPIPAATTGSWNLYN